MKRTPPNNFHARNVRRSGSSAALTSMIFM
jgi:hypothetical protein